MNGWGWLTGTLLTAGTLLGAQTAAWADGSPAIINLGSGWVQSANDPLFDVRHITPGWDESRTLEIRNDGSRAAELALRVANLAEDENGCNPPEALVDSTCGAAAGELGHRMLLTVYADPEDDGTFEPSPRWAGSLYDLTDRAILASSMPAGSTWGLRIEAGLPVTVTNQTQTDQVRFDMQFLVDGEGPVVEGTKVTRPPRGVLGSVVDRLPFTGTEAGRLVTGAGWLAVAGVLLVQLGRRRRPRTRLN